MSNRRRAATAIPISQWPLDDAINVVLFAGLGGACAGLEEAGCPVHVANNHDDVALAAHAAMHPHTRHVRGDIFDVDPVEATRGRSVKVLWASPDCKDHSVAKGGAPRSPRVRSLPWQICRWMGKVRGTDGRPGPALVMMENVREIRGWGPLIAKRCNATGRVLRLDGSVAAPGERVPMREQQLVRDPRRAGRTFRALIKHIRSFGYVYEDRDLCAADYGIPTTRRRWFAVARRDGQPIGWPVQTHWPRKDAARLGTKPWVAASSIIDWSLPMPSIFDRKRPLADATMRRTAVGVQRYVLDNSTPFLVPITHHGELSLVAPFLTGCGGRAGQVPPSSPEEPVGTITTKGDRVVCGAALIQVGYGEREGQSPRALDINQPLGTLVCSNKHAVIAAWLAQHNTGVTGNSAHDPLSTMTTRVTQQQVACGYLVKLRGTSTAQDAAEPVPTLSAGGNHIATVAAFMTKYYGTGGQHQGCEEPLHTLSTRDRFGVVGVTLGGKQFILADIGMRMLEPHEAAAAHGLRLPKEISVDGKRRALTKTEAMRLIGNSVPKDFARLLAQANVVHALTAPGNVRKVA